MKKHRYVGLRVKLVVYTVLCVAAVGLVSNAFLYRYSQRVIQDKASNVNRLSVEVIAGQLNYSLERAQTLELYCANAQEVIHALKPEGRENQNDLLLAQNAMNACLRTSPVDSYISKLFLFNEDSVLVHAVTGSDGYVLDFQRLAESEQYRRWKSGELRPFDQVYDSLNPDERPCFALFSTVYASSTGAELGCIYMEVDTELVTDILMPYNERDLFFVQPDYGPGLIPETDQAFLAALAAATDWNRISYRNEQYVVRCYPLVPDTLTLCSGVNQTAIVAGHRDMAGSVAMVTLMAIGIAAIILAAMTHYITEPINRIMDKINRIAFNDYEPNPELEEPNNEMGQVGVQLNQLGLAVRNLLDETIHLHDQRTEIEMALLQSQVNPHFLYNTLNSVLWMAIMQKNTGIEKVVRSLVNLLKNVSKGVSDRIPLSEELALLDDYISIQSVRYVGDFDYICRVPEELRDYRLIKFTLQPLVENAIFHGVIPKETFGTITVDAREEGDFLLITVADDGVGLLPQEMETLLSEERSTGKSGLNGIGVYNVNRRLKLAYGRECGLSLESEKGVYTCVTVRIPKER